MLPLFSKSMGQTLFRLAYTQVLGHALSVGISHLDGIDVTGFSDIVNFKTLSQNAIFTPQICIIL